MKKWVGFIMVAAVLAGLGYWIWLTFFPSPEKAIRKQLQALAAAASFPVNEAPRAKLANAQKLGNFFTTDVEVTVETPGRAQQTFSGRDELVQAALGAHSSLNGLNVEFLDINVTVAPNKQTAVANLTARARIPGDRDFNVQELKFSLKKVGGDWLIYKVETVKTLSWNTEKIPRRNARVELRIAHPPLLRRLAEERAGERRPSYRESVTSPTGARERIS